MALHTELPIHRTGVRLLALAVRVQEQMPRSVKRILGEKITQHCVDMLDLMALANATKQDLRAQGFPASYVIDRGADGRPLSKAAQVRMCGNSVCPPLAAAIVRANYAERQAQRAAA
jgi:hypothetical protein